MAQENLKHKATKGVFWTSIQKFAGMGISFISGIILARLLTPDDFGCIGMLYIFIVIANSIVDGGFASALIQKKRPTQEDYSTIFFFNLGMSVIMYALLFLCAPLIARFYKMPLLSAVLRVQGVVLLFNAFSIIQSNILRKQFQFKKLAIVTLFTSVVSLSTTILMAYKGFGVWSLVAMHLLSSFVPMVVYWLSNKWRPLLVFSATSFKELFGFGFFMFMTNIINNICNNVQGLLIGRFYNSATMGYYSKARHTEELASTSISNIMGQVTYPLYAEYQHDLPKLIMAIKKITKTISYITFPLMLLLILLAKQIFILLYSDRWLGSVPYFQILCLAGIAVCLQGVNYQAVAAVGKSKAMFNWTIIKRIIGLAFIVLGMLLWGIKGILLGMVLQSWIVYIINAYLVHKYIGFNLFEQLLDILPILCLSVASMAVAYCMVFILRDSNMYLLAVIQFIVFMAVYLGGSVLFKMDSLSYLMEEVQVYLAKGRKK